MGPLGYRHCHHPNHQHLVCRHCRGLEGLFHSNRQTVLVNRKFRRYHRQGHLNH